MGDRDEFEIQIVERESEQRRRSPVPRRAFGADAELAGPAAPVDFQGSVARELAGVRFALPGSDRVGGPIVVVPAALDPFDELVALLDRGVAISRHEPRDPLGLVGRENAIQFVEVDGVVAEPHQ